LNWETTILNQMIFQIQTNFKPSSKNRIFRLLNEKWFWNLIQNLNCEEFRNKVFKASFQIPVSNKLKSKSNFDESELFLYALED
jgi:hypothetical protein